MRRNITTVFLVFTLLLQLACSEALINRVAKAAEALPAVVRALQPDPAKNKLALDGLEIFIKALNDFRASGRSVFKWDVVLNVWEDLQRRNVFNLSASNQAKIDAIVALVGVLLGQVIVPVGVTGSGGGADTSSDKVLTDRINKADVEKLEALLK